MRCWPHITITSQSQSSYRSGKWTETESSESSLSRSIRCNECQAFLQLDVNRLVLHRQLLVIDVKDTPCTLVEKASVRDGHANWKLKHQPQSANWIVRIILFEPDRDCVWPSEFESKRPDSIMNWYFAFFWSPQVTLTYLPPSRSLHSWLLQKWIPNPDDVRKSLFYTAHVVNLAAKAPP